MLNFFSFYVLHLQNETASCKAQIILRWRDAASANYVGEYRKTKIINNLLFCH